jgi:hypothetical protein
MRYQYARRAGEGAPKMSPFMAAGPRYTSITEEVGLDDGVSVLRQLGLISQG